MIKNLKFASCGLLLLAMFCKCSTGEKVEYQKIDTLTTTSYNVIIAPDLSNRILPNLYRKPIHDIVLINRVLDSIETFLSINNRTIGQKDIYKIDFINTGILNNKSISSKELEIDLNKFHTLGELSDYLRNDLVKDRDAFKKQLKLVYEISEKNIAGSDIWNYLNETIHSSLSSQTPTYQKSKRCVVGQQTKNVLLLFTDGYIENTNNSPGYVLNSAMINEIRKQFLASGETKLEDFILSNPKYQIKATENLNGTNIFVAEVIDRSLDINGVAKYQPTDYQISKIIWNKWLKDSGAGKICFSQVVSSEKKFQNNLLEFIRSL